MTLKWQQPKINNPSFQYFKSQDYFYFFFPRLFCFVFESVWLAILTNCIKYFIPKWTKQLLAPRHKSCPTTEAQEAVFSPKTLPLPQLTQSFPHLPAVLLNPQQPSSSTSGYPSHPPKIFTSSSIYLSMFHVTTTILIWCIILWSLELAHVQFLLTLISRIVTIPGTHSKLCQWPLGSTLWFSR